MIKKTGIKETNFNSWYHQTGATMIELMVTLFIVAVGLLGVAALQSVGLRQATDSHTTAQAQILVQDLSEMILAFDAEASGNYAADGVPASQGKDCTALICTKDELAQYNIWTWAQNMQPALPSYDLDINFTAATDTYEIILTWDAQREGANYSAATCASDDTFKDGCLAMLLTLSN